MSVCVLFHCSNIQEFEQNINQLNNFMVVKMENNIQLIDRYSKITFSYDGENYFVNSKKIPTRLGDYIFKYFLM
jgi:hypothetical protein